MGGLGMTAVVEMPEAVIEAGGVEAEAVRLAGALCIATLIDRPLLRRARLELLAGVNAGAEGDLWFGPLVESRSRDELVLRRDVQAWLRAQLQVDQRAVKRAGRMTLRMHRHLPP